MAPRPRNRKNRDLPLNVYESRGSYVWRHPITGKRFGIGNDKQEAFAQAHEANMAVLELIDKPRLIHRILGAPETMADWIDKYLELIDKRLQDGKIAKSTHASTRQRCKTIRESSLGSLILKEITSRTVLDFLGQYVKTPRMAQGMRSLLIDIFREANLAGWCEKNPVEITRAERVITKRQRLSLDQFMAIYQQAQANGPVWMVHILELALLTGQRRGDLAKMRYKDISDGCLNVTQQKNKVTDLVGHKVAIPLEIGIAGFTLEQTIASTRNVFSEYLVHHTNKVGRANVGAKIREQSISAEFQNLREAAGLTGDNLPTIHEVRSLSARLYAAAYGEEFAQALLGHKSKTMAALYQDERDGWFRPKIATN
jgi:integrase